MFTRFSSAAVILLSTLLTAQACIWKPQSKSTAVLQSVTEPELEVIAKRPEESQVLIPSYPLRVLAKFILSGVSFGPGKSQDDFLIRRFNQAMEYLQAYYSLPERDASHIQSYKELLGEMHAGLKAQSQFADEMDMLIDKNTGQVIMPLAAHAPLNLASLPSGSEAEKLWKEQRAKLSEFVKQKNLKEEIAKILASRSTDLPRAAAQLAAQPFQMLGLGPIADSLSNGVNFWLSGVESAVQFAVNPFIREIDLDTLEREIKRLAATNFVVKNQPQVALQVMRGAEILLQETQKILKSKMQQEVNNGRFELKPSSNELLTGKPDPKRLFVSNLLSVTLGGYLELLPEKVLKNLVSDLIDAADANPSPKAAIMLAAQAAGPLLKKTMQMYAREESLDADLSEVLKSVESSNEAMNFADVRKSVQTLVGGQVTQITEKPIGVGSIADVYLVLLKPAHVKPANGSLDLGAIQREWRAQSCLALLGSQALLDEKGKITVNSDCEISAPDALKAHWFAHWLWPSNNNTNQDSRAVPAILRVIKPGAKELLEAEKEIFKKLSVTFDARMTDLEKQYSQYELNLPRMTNLVSSLIQNIEDELDIKKTVKNHELARAIANSQHSPYEVVQSIKRSSSADDKKFIVRTRVPQASLAIFGADAPLAATGACFMEYLPGDDLENTLHKDGVSAADRKEIGKALLKMWLKSAIYTDEKLIHADLHAGNLLSQFFKAQNGDAVLQVSVIDFGMAVHRPASDQSAQDTANDFSDELINLGIASYFGNTNIVLNALRGLATKESVAVSSLVRQQEAATEYLGKMRAKNAGQNPNMEDWFLWSQNLLASKDRLVYAPTIVNLMMGYIRINDLVMRLGGRGEDAIEVNKELALEPGNWKKIARSYSSALTGTLPEFLKALDKMRSGNEESKR